MSDDEREQFIKRTGQQMVQAHRRGERGTALDLQRVMYEAIAARSPAKKRAMEESIQRRLDEGVCYFSSDAALALGLAGSTLA